MDQMASSALVFALALLSVCSAFCPMQSFRSANSQFLVKSVNTNSPTAGSARSLHLSCAGLAGLSMQKEGAGKSRKGPRSRKARAERREAGGFILDPKGGPVGKAKRNIMQRQYDDEANRAFDWDNLKQKLQAERDEDGYPTGWAGNMNELKKKQEIWNADLRDGYVSEVDDNGISDTNVTEWKQVRDPVSGDVYFWNVETEEVTWDLPEGVKSSENLSPFRGVTKTIPSPADTGLLWLCTQHNTGHAHYGIFFQIDAKDQDVYVVGLRTGSHYHSDIYECKYRVWVREGSVYGHETSKEGWTQYGFKEVKAEVRKIGPKKWESMGLTREIKTVANTKFDLLPTICESDLEPEILYGAVPLERAIHIPAGTSKSVCLWCEDSMGIILRKAQPYLGGAKKQIRRIQGGFFKQGQVTDENTHLAIRAGLVPRKDVFRGVCSPDGYAAFVGVVEYALEPSKVPERSSTYAETEGKTFDPNNVPPLDFLQAPQAPTNEGKSSKISAKKEAAEIQADESTQMSEEEEDEEDVDEDDEEGVDVDMETLMKGPQENFFGGGKDDDDEGEWQPPTLQFGAYTLMCYKDNKEIGDMSVSKQSTWDEVLSSLEQKAGSKVAAFTFSNPDGSGSVRVQDADTWKKCLEILEEEAQELEGMLEIDLVMG